MQENKAQTQLASLLGISQDGIREMAIRAINEVVARRMAEKDAKIKELEERVGILSKGIVECEGDGGCRGHKFL